MNSSRGKVPPTKRSNTPPQGHTRIITFASSKGGVGKSTSCLAVGCALALSGARVQILDLDQNYTLKRWSERFARPELSSLEVVSLTDPAGLDEHLDAVRESGSADWVLIDIAGAYEQTLVFAIAAAHITLIPAQLSEPDIHEAGKIIRTCRKIETRFNRALTYAVLLTQVQALASRPHSFLLDKISQSGIPRLTSTIGQRAVFRDLFLSGLPPHLDPSRGEKAAREINALIHELESLLAPAQPLTKGAA